MKSNFDTKPWLVLAILALCLTVVVGVAVAANPPQNQPASVASSGAGQSFEDKRKLFHDAMKANFEKDKPLFTQMHDLHKKLRDALVANPFNKDTYLSIKDEIEKTRTQIQNDRATAFASAVAQFTPEERETLMRHRHHGRGHFHHHRHNRHHGWHRHHHHRWKHHRHGDRDRYDDGAKRHGEGMHTWQDGDHSTNKNSSSSQGGESQPSSPTQP